jgi:lysophospholipase L1-like esterase
METAHGDGCRAMTASRSTWRAIAANDGEAFDALPAEAREAYKARARAAIRAIKEGGDPSNMDEEIARICLGIRKKKTRVAQA